MRRNIAPDPKSSPFDFRSLLQGVHILWLNTSGAYVAGLHRCFPIDTIACLDDGEDLDLLAADGALTFLRVEAASACRSLLTDRAIEDVLPLLEREIQSRLEERPRDSWLVVCPRPCRTLERFVAGR